MSRARRAFLVTFVLRLSCSLFAWRFGAQIPPNLFVASRNQLSSHLLGPADGWRYLIYGIWDRFDTLWYLNIAAHGYDRPAAIVFYPLYPFLIRCATWFTREPTVAALAISTVAFMFVLWGIQELAALDWPGREIPALAVLAAWPASFIFLAAYPESLLIALVVWSVYFARTDRWWSAGILACIAGLTKAVGLLASIPLIVFALRERRWKSLPAVAVAPLGFLSYAAWLKLSGFPTTTEVYARYWATQVSLPWDTFTDACLTVVRDGDWLVGINLAALLFCVTILLLAKGMRLEYLLFSVACLVMFLTKHTQQPLQSTARYVLLIFPMFLYLAGWLKNTKPLLLFLLLSCPFYFAMLRMFLWWGLVT